MAPVIKNLPANTGDVGSVFGCERSTREGSGNHLFQHCSQGNPMDRGACQASVHGVVKEVDVT